jgi:ATP-binding cassette subfamily C exporter for protease/lipase
VMNERSTQPPLVRANRTSQAAQMYADGSLRNAQVIEAMGMLPDIHKRWLGKQQEFLQLQAEASERAGLYTALSKMLQNVMSSLLLGLACYLLLERMLNGGGAMLIVSSILGGRVLKPLVELVTQWRTMVNARDAYKRLDTLLTAVPPKPDAMPLPAPRGRILAESLVVNAPGTQAPILRGVSFMLNPGEAVAVIGPSAAGKTTLARALTGVWPSLGGKARLDGADIHAWNKEEVGPHVGYLPQGVELFDGTIAENIARFGDVDKAKVERAAKAIGLHEFILSLPNGYDTELGAEGARLSGGQRQRVGLARAFYGDPVFVVLDEPNSSLDEDGETALLQLMADAKSGGTTVVAITHRASLLKACEKVLMLRDGQVQAFGPRDDVMAAIAKAAAEANAKAQAAQQQRAAIARPELAA